MQIKLTKAQNETNDNEIALNEPVHNETNDNEIVQNKTEHNEMETTNEIVKNEMETTNEIVKNEILDEPKCNKIKEQLKSISIGYKEWDSIQWLTGC